jgi:hypothetical protein
MSGTIAVKNAKINAGISVEFSICRTENNAVFAKTYSIKAKLEARNLERKVENKIKSEKSNDISRKISQVADISSKNHT